MPGSFPNSPLLHARQLISNTPCALPPSTPRTHPPAISNTLPVPGPCTCSVHHPWGCTEWCGSLCADEALNLIGAAFPFVEVMRIGSCGDILLTDSCAACVLPQLRELTVASFAGGPLSRAAPNCTRLEVSGCTVPVIDDLYVARCPYGTIALSTQLRELQLQIAPWEQGGYNWGDGRGWQAEKRGFGFLRCLPHLTCLGVGGLHFTQERGLHSEEGEGAAGQEEEEGARKRQDAAEGAGAEDGHWQDEASPLLRRADAEQPETRFPQRDALAAWCRDWGNLHELCLWGSLQEFKGSGVCIDVALPLLAQHVGARLRRLTIKDCELSVNEHLKKEELGGQGVLDCLPLFSALEALTLQLSQELSVCLDDESAEKFLAPLQARGAALRRVAVVLWRGRDEMKAPHVSWECCVRLMERYVPLLTVEYNVQF